MKIVSWNVNGIRACLNKGAFQAFMDQHQPDFLGIQETKLHDSSLVEDWVNQNGYQSVWNGADKKGYSGVAFVTKLKPDEVLIGMESPQFDCEGRIISARFGSILIHTVYFPNGQQSPERLHFKLAFYDAFFQYCDEWRSNGVSSIIIGDFNTAHHPIDLARPTENETVSGFLPIEREWLTQLEHRHYIDTFRLHHPNQAHQYSWWTYRAGARQRNVGWRIDYVWVDQSLTSCVTDAFILPDVMGSDHCPVGIQFLHEPH